MRAIRIFTLALVFALGIAGSLWWGQSEEAEKGIHISELKNLPIGCLGKQLGAKTTITCQLAFNSGYRSGAEKKSKASPPAKECPHCPVLVKVSKIDNMALSKEIEITLTNAPTMEPEIDYIFHGFERGEFSGMPDWVEQGQIVEPLLHYRPLFVITGMPANEQR